MRQSFYSDTCQPTLNKDSSPHQNHAMEFLYQLFKRVFSGTSQLSWFTTFLEAIISPVITAIIMRISFKVTIKQSIVQINDNLDENIIDSIYHIRIEL